MPVTIEDGKPFSGLFLLKAPPLERVQKDGKPYLSLVLGTPRGSWEAKMWSTSLASLGGLEEGDPVRAEGSAERYQGRMQLRVLRLAREAGNVDPRELYPSASRSEADLRGDYRARVSALGDPHLRGLLAAVAADAPFLDAFFRAPAAAGMHHARIGGLAEHSLAVASIVARTAGSYPLLRAELAVTGALLHDAGKVREYECAGDFRFTREGRMLGHVALGAVMIEGWVAAVPGFPRELALDLAHILIAHHGSLELGSPREPVTAEALVVHFADDLDAKLDMIAGAAGEGGDEGYVRGLRRTFFFAPDAPSTLRHAQGGQGSEEAGQGSSTGFPSTGSTSSPSSTSSGQGGPGGPRGQGGLFE
jgi:3'-5' exoribonuclease